MTELPKPFAGFREDYPEIAQAYEALGNAAHSAGPLDDKARQLVKLALAIGAGLEGATHAHTRRALELEVTPDEIRHVALLSITTLGFPTAIRAITWIEDVISGR
ncbi:MAG: carboxymuconolactone decarboxylase family protein [Chloroflexi bacterium]|nr:carboxymuconolactone decarboxylase family protein [Chloroflexota bacterium]